MDQLLRVVRYLFVCVANLQMENYHMISTKEIFEMWKIMVTSQTVHERAYVDGKAMWVGWVSGKLLVWQTDVLEEEWR